MVVGSCEAFAHSSGQRSEKSESTGEARRFRERDSNAGPLRGGRERSGEEWREGGEDHSRVGIERAGFRSRAGDRVGVERLTVTSE